MKQFSMDDYGIIDGDDWWEWFSNRRTQNGATLPEPMIQNRP